MNMYKIACVLLLSLIAVSTISCGDSRQLQQEPAPAAPQKDVFTPVSPGAGRSDSRANDSRAKDQRPYQTITNPVK